MPYVKADGTVVHADGTKGMLTPTEMEYRDRYNEWVRLPANRRLVTPRPPMSHDNRAGLMQKYIDPEAERRITDRLNGTPLLRGLIE